MKKLIFISLLGMLALTSPAQETPKHKPYLSAGGGIGMGIPTYGLEIGGYTEKIWYCAVVEITSDANNAIYGGIKTYYRLTNFNDTKTQLFTFFAGKIGEKKDLVLEPGLAFVYSFSNNWGLQWNLSSPLYEETPLFNPTHLSAGLSLNYWF